MSVGRADPAVRHPLDEVLGGHVDEDRSIDAPARLGQRGIEGLGLDPCPREAVENGPGAGIGLFQTIEEDAHDRLVRHELAAAHVPIGLTTERRALGDRGPEQVARREHRHAEVAGEDRRLRSLARSRRAEEHDHGHRTRRRTRSAADQLIE